MAVSLRRYAVIVSAVVLALCVNLSVYAAGRAAGGDFTYTQSGKKISVDAAAVTLLSTIPLAVGLTLVVLLSRRWPVMFNVAAVLAPVFAVATIALVTLPANFDTTSTIFLSTMHLALIPISLLALYALRPRGA